MKRFSVSLAICCCLSACDLSRRELAPHVEPIHEPAFRLLIVEETSDRPRLPASQQAIFTSVSVRQYLKSHCTKEADGTPAFRMVDKDAEFAGDWAATVHTHPPRSYPWLYVTNGKAGYSGPLPRSVEELLTLIKPYAEGRKSKASAYCCPLKNRNHATVGDAASVVISSGNCRGTPTNSLPTLAASATEKGKSKGGGTSLNFRRQFHHA